MTIPPLGPTATQHDSMTDPHDEEPEDAQTQQLREENRALRELLAAQVQASLPQPGPARRLGWWLISAPGAALVGWRRLLGRGNARPMTGKRVGYATLTVLYTLAIYGALVLLVVSWSTPKAARSGVNAAGPVRVPLQSPPAPGKESQPKSFDPAATSTPSLAAVATDERVTTAAGTEPSPGTPATSSTEPDVTETPPSDRPAISSHTPAPRDPAATPAPSTPPKSTLRITEIPAENPHAWVDHLKAALARCATLGFFERPDCAWAARKQFCEPNQGWGAIKECPILQ